MEETKPEAVVPAQFNEVTNAVEVKPDSEPMDTDAVAAPAKTPSESEASSVKSEPVDEAEFSGSTPAADITPETAEKVKEEAPEPSEAAGTSKATVAAPRTPRTPRAVNNKAAAGTKSIMSFFAPKSKAVKNEPVDQELEVIESPKKKTATPKSPAKAKPVPMKTRSSPRNVKKEPEPEEVVREEPAASVENTNAWKLAPIGYFSGVEKLIDVCKKFHGPQKIPLSNMKFDGGYEEDDELVDETVEKLLSGELTEEHFTQFTGTIAQKDCETKKPEKWSVLILKKQHLISAFRNVKNNAELNMKSPSWVKNSASKLTVELVGVPNGLHTNLCKKVENDDGLELTAAVSAVFYDEGNATEGALVKATRDLAIAKKAESDKHWNSFIEQGVLQSRGSNLKYVFLMCCAPKELYEQYKKMVHRNKTSESTDKIIDVVLEMLVVKCLEFKNDIKGLVELLKNINAEKPVLTPEQIVQRIKAFEAPRPVEAPPAPIQAPVPEPEPVASSSKAEPARKRKARSSGVKPQVKKERIEDDENKSVSDHPPSGSEAHGGSDYGSEVKSEATENEPMQVAAQDNASEASVKSEFDIPDIDFDPTSLPANVTLIQTPLTCAIFTQVEQEKEDNICIWTNDLDPDIITAAHLNSSKIIVLAEKAETFEDEEVVEIMKRTNAVTADFTVMKSDDTVIQWSYICFGDRTIPDGIKNKLFHSFKEVEKLVQKNFEADKKKTTSMVRYANDDLLNSLSKQLQNTVIGCNYIAAN